MQVSTLSNFLWRPLEMHYQQGDRGALLCFISTDRSSCCKAAAIALKIDTGLS